MKSKAHLIYLRRAMELTEQEIRRLVSTSSETVTRQQPLELSSIYAGREMDFLNDKSKAKTFETKFLETRKKTILFAPQKPLDIPEEIRNEFNEVRSNFLEEPEDYLDEYYAIKQKYKEYLPDLLEERKEPVYKYRVEIDNEKDPSHYGYTGLRILGNPNEIESIELQIGGAQIDIIHPSVSGSFETLFLFNHVIPRPIFHKIWLIVSFKKPLNVPTRIDFDWDVVTIKNQDQNYKLHTRINRYRDSQIVPNGYSSILFDFCHPIETIRIYSSIRVDSINLKFDDVEIYIPYKRQVNGWYLFEYHFIHPVNFSKVNKAYINLVSSYGRPVEIKMFTVAWNIVNFMGGMAQLSFSH